MTQPDPDPEARSVWEEARALIDRLEGSSVQRLAVEAGAYRIEIERALPQAAPGVAPAFAAAPALDGAAAAEPDDRHAITAPLVGQFYRAGKPGAPPFVEPGDIVEAGQTVCIVEAMKMMNEVAAEMRGRVADIVVENEEYVEFGQALMHLEPLDGGTA